MSEEISNIEFHKKEIMKFAARVEKKDLPVTQMEDQLLVQFASHTDYNSYTAYTKSIFTLFWLFQK
jgi:hypothetical protein